MPFLGRGSWVPIYHNVDGAEAYLHAKLHLDPSNCLATIQQHHRQDRQTDRQRSDSIGKTALQTVAQKTDLKVSHQFYKRHLDNRMLKCHQDL